MNTTVRTTVHNFNSYEEMIRAMKDYSQQNQGTQFLCRDDPKAFKLGYITEDSSQLYQIGLEEFRQTAHTLSDEHNKLVRTAAGRARIASLCSS
jgi:hypothetical protein